MATAARLLAVATGLGKATENPNYPAPTLRPVWCAVPNYRVYRLTPHKARGFPPSDSRTCDLEAGKPDGCFCVAPEDCLSGFCVLDDNGAGECMYPLVQISEIEFWRSGQRVNTAKIPDNGHDAFRVANNADVRQTWGVWELEFYRDTSCGNRIEGGAAIASSERKRGFGHSVDHTAPLGLHDTPRTYWQSTHERPVETFDLHGPAAFAFDADPRTNWWAACENPCHARTEWLGLDYRDDLDARGDAVVLGGMKCVRILQDKDRDYASFSLLVQGHRVDGGGWDTFAVFNAATWEWGGVWETLMVPQGVAFIASVGHARALDFDLNSSVVEFAGSHMDFDFGVETELDAWRWATAEEPADNTEPPWSHDGATCDRDGRCPRDPVRWTLQGSLDGSSWVTLQSQDEDYPVTVHRKQWLPFQPVHHHVDLSILDVWPDGRGRCAAHR